MNGGGLTSGKKSISLVDCGERSSTATLMIRVLKG